ncbi:GAP family protein [Nocardiopsis oceani]
MTFGLLTALVGLALLDSTAFGTLLIPLWLLMAPGKVRVGRMAVYLGTVVAFYFVAGLAIAAGADMLVDAVRDTFAQIPDAVLLSLQLAAGAALVVAGIWWGVRSGKRAEDTGPGRLQRWRDRAMTGAGGNGNGSVMKLALIAVGLEAATMLPYLVSIGLLVNAQLGIVGYAGWLGLYNLIMVLPAALITLARLFWHRRLDPVLHRLNNYLAKSSSSAVVWILVILGGGLAAHAGYALVTG